MKIECEFCEEEFSFFVANEGFTNGFSNEYRLECPNVDCKNLIIVKSECPFPNQKNELSEVA